MSFAAEFFRAPVAEFVQLGKVMPGVDVEQRHREVRRPKCFFGEPQQADRIFAAGEQQSGPLEFGRDFAHDVDGFGFEILEMIEMIASHRANEASNVI